MIQPTADVEYFTKTYFFASVIISAIVAFIGAFILEEGR